MNRLLAKIFLLLIIFGLLVSMYFFYHGRFVEGLFMYPLLGTVYVVMTLVRKKKE